MGKKKEISITLLNNTSGKIPITVLNNPYNTSSIINQRTSYTYDFSSFSFTNENSVDLQYRNVGGSSYSTVTGVLQSSTLQGIVDVLNSLKIATFYLSGTDIITYNDKIELGDILVYNDSALVTFNWHNNTNVVGSGQLTLDDTINTLVISPNGLSQSGTLNLPVGTQIRINASGNALEGFIGIYLYSTPPFVPVTVIYQVNGFDTTFTYLFTLADPALTYNLFFT